MNPARRCPGSTLFVTMTVLAALSLMAAFTLQRVTPKFRMAYQNAAWQESRMAAEAGIDAAIGDLHRNALGNSAGDWPGWKQENNGLIGPVLNTTINLVGSVLSLLGGNTSIAQASAQPIFLDNLNVSSSSGVPTEVDVQMWALPTSASQPRRWFRIRSMATCALPPTADTAPAQLDSSLRRFSLRAVRPQLRKDDVGAPTTIPTPNVSRVVEVLVEPILPFELAIWTDRTLTLGTGAPWRVDSYDSRDPLKSSPTGTYPGGTSPLVQENGHVASNLGCAPGTPYGPLISAQGTHVHGTVATNGGDDPATPEHENVAGAIALDPARIRDDFHREMRPVVRPTTGVYLRPPLFGQPFVPGPETTPTQYLVKGNLGPFTVSAPANGVRGAVLIAVNGNLDTASGTIIVPPTVTVILFVRGSIDFRNCHINSGPWSSNRPAQLQIYGEGTGTGPRTVRAYGDAAIAAAFYGPQHDIELTGDVEWSGSLAGRSFAMLGTGTGGVHYDEALARYGTPISFRIARYVEDVRE